jgi:hypothetical protein
VIKLTLDWTSGTFIIQIERQSWYTNLTLTPLCRPTIAITKAHMKLAEMEMSAMKGGLAVDGKIVVNSMGELAVSKAAVEPVWYLPGVASRFGIDEGVLRRALL